MRANHAKQWLGSDGSPRSMMEGSSRGGRRKPEAEWWPGVSGNAELGTVNLIGYCSRRRALIRTQVHSTIGWRTTGALPMNMSTGAFGQ